MKKVLLTLYVLLMTASAHALPFETTPNPTTYPIQWYYLKTGGYYLFAPSYEELDSSPTSSSSDEYLWCFLLSNTGKITVYNKALGKCLCDGWYFTPYFFSQSTDYVEVGSGNNFYICANIYGQKGYLDCSYGSISFRPEKWDPVIAIKATFEDYIDTGETIVFSDLEVHDDYCSFYFETENHQYGCELVLYVNGRRVGMPYFIQRTNEVQIVEAEGHIVYSIPRLREVVASKTYEIPARENHAIKGDVDGSGLVDVDDVNAVINLILFYDQYKDKYPGNGDVDGSGLVDVDDVNAIINIILGK